MMRTALLGFVAVVAAACTSQQDQRAIRVAMCSAPIISAPVATDPYVLGNMSVAGNLLVVHVQTSGGCAAHSFAACWDGITYDTFPPIADLALSHDAHGDTCDALLSVDLDIDLTPMLEASVPPAVLHVTGETAQQEGTSDVVRIRD